MSAETIRTRAEFLANRLLTSRFCPAFKWLWRHIVPPLRFKRVLFGNWVFGNLRDHLFLCYTSRRSLEQLEGVCHVIAGLPHGSVIWDVGCNVGIYALYAARLGHRVIAFDLSPSAIRLLDKSARYNGLLVKGVARALTQKFQLYPVPSSAWAGNRVNQKLLTRRYGASIPWKQAVKEFDKPSLIKMDIEGGEREFLEDLEFREWLRENQILFAVELHDENRMVSWQCSDGLTHLGANNYLIRAKDLVAA